MDLYEQGIKDCLDEQVVKCLEGQKDQKCQDCMEQEVVQNKQMVQISLEQEVDKDDRESKDCLESLMGQDE